MTQPRRSDGFQPFAVLAASGPHLTPQAGVSAYGRYWTTTSRRAYKRRLLARCPIAATAVSRCGTLVVQSGRATVFDALAPIDAVADPIGWSLSGAAVGRLGVAQLTAMAGYAKIMRSIPVAWNVAGRVLVAARPDHTITIEGHEIVEAGGQWRRVPPQAPDIAAPGPAAPLDTRQLPEPVGALVEDEAESECSLSYLSAAGPVALPAAWDSATRRASIPRSVVQRTGRRRDSAIAITLDASNGPHPTDKYGLMLRGTGELVAGPDPTLVSFAVRGPRLTWWIGFESNTVLTPR